VGLALLLLVGATPPASAADYVALCGQQRWTDQNPSDCQKEYRVYKTTGNRPRLVFHTYNSHGVDWEEITRNYEAAEKWCTTHPIACDLITAAGLAIVASLYAQATS
jgi:polygalacturonase